MNLEMGWSKDIFKGGIEEGDIKTEGVKERIADTAPQEYTRSHVKHTESRHV